MVEYDHELKQNYPKCIRDLRSYLQRENTHKNNKAH